MATSGPERLGQLPDEMFSIIKAASAGIGPRLGRLALPGRNVVETPHYLGITSRGVVPHLTQETLARETSISGVYVPLEDSERAPSQVPPLYECKPPDSSSPLRRFIALSDPTLLVLGARRTPPVVAPPANPNTNTTISICTAVGFRVLQVEDYAEAAENLRADIVVGLGDVPYGRVLGAKRIEKATDRSIQWTSNHIALRQAASCASSQTRLFAPLLPVSCANQRFYLDYLSQEAAEAVSGLAIYSLDSLEDLPGTLTPLPRLGFTAPVTPHEVLRHVALGLDVVTTPLANAATDAGIALDFDFALQKCSTVEMADGDLHAFGIDMWSTTHAIDLSPLVAGCKCYTCTAHHRAYLQHLLAAKEMLGWVLLQIHNHHTMDLFFAGIRRSIARGTFEKDVEEFVRQYESHLPETAGLGPRIRGYQFRSEGPGEAKKNKPPYVKLDKGKGEEVDSTPPSGDADTSELDGLP